jgi:hypothetical protein
MRLLMRGLSGSIVLTGWIVSAIICVVPPLILMGWGVIALWNRTDYYLSQAAPIVASEASQALGRTITIGRITPGLTLQRLWGIFQNPNDFGSLPITITDITVANTATEARLAGRPLFATVPRVTVLASVPRLLSGNYQEAMKRVVVESPDIILVRDPKGVLNVTRIVPPQPPSEEPVVPFRTQIEVTNGKLFFRDYLALFPAASLPAQNAFSVPSASLDMTGVRVYRFALEGRALPGSPTVAHFGGRLIAHGTTRRDEGQAVERPGAGAPHLLANLEITDADVAYWTTYFIRQSGYRIEAGRTDATVDIYQPYVENGPEAPPVVGIEASFRNGRFTATNLPRPLTAENLAGTASFREGALLIDINGTTLNAPVSASGAIWDLPAPGASTRPQFSVAVSAPSLPVGDVVRFVTPANGKGALPVGLKVGGIAAVMGTVAGRATGRIEDLYATGTVRGLSGSYTDFPSVSEATSQVALAAGTLRLTGISARLGRAGTIAGSATAKLTGQKESQGDAVFSAKINNVDLSELTALKSLSSNQNQRLQLAGIADVEAVGRNVGGKLTAVANISTRNLRVGDLPFPVANARVVSIDNQIGVTTARIESPAGIVSVDGSVGAGGRLNLRYALNALDLKRLSLAFGQTGIDGVLSASGSISGDMRNPIARISRLEGINLRFAAPVPSVGIPLERGVSRSVNISLDNSGTTRQFAIDAISASNLTITRDRFLIPPTNPLVVRRFPASLAVSGTVTGLIPTTGKAFNPRMGLTARLENLDYSEIERQLGLSVAATSPQSVLTRRFSLTPLNTGLELTPWYQGRLVVRAGDSARLPLVRDLPPVSGSILYSDFAINGTLTAPNVRGKATLGNLQVANYPLQGASLAFSFTPQLTVLTDVTINATVGNLIGKATLRGDGTINGDFAAPALDISRVTYLMGDLGNLQGALSASGSFQGTIKRPIITARFSSPILTLAGTTYTDFLVNQLRCIANLDAKRYVLEIPSVSIGRDKTKIQAGKLYADFSTGELRGTLDVKNGNFEVLLDTIRRSGISQTAGGAAIVRGLAQLPYPTDAKFDIENLTASAKLVNGKMSEIRAAGSLTARELKLGEFTADSLNVQASLEGEKITIPSLVITHPGATIRGQGTYDPNGMVQASLDSNEFSLDFIRSIRGLESFPIRGSLESFSLTAEGSAKQPRLALSLQGRNLFVVTNTAMRTSTTASPQDEQGITIPLTRLEAFLEQDAQGRYNIIVPEDGLYIQRGDLQLRAAAQLPFSYENDPTLGERPIRVSARLPRVDLSSLRSLFVPAAVLPPNPEALTRPERAAANSAKAQAAALEAATTDIGGTFAADVAISGTLRQPQLDGAVSLVNGRYRMAREPGSDRDKVSPVRSFDALLRLDGNQIIFDQFRLTLGGLNGQRGDYGSMEVAGSVAINTLENLRRLLSRGTATDAPGIDGRFDLDVKLKNFRPVAENLFKLREAFKLKANGNLKVAGRLLTPEISTVGDPLELTDSEIRLPLDSATKSESKPAVSFNPSFNLAISIPRKATLRGLIAGQTFLPYQFDLQGDAQLTGPLFVANGPTAGSLALGVTSNVRTNGGFIQFPTALLRVAKNGIIQARFNTASPGLVAQNVVATSRITARGTTSASGSPIGAEALFGSGTNTYKITLTLNGPLDNIISSNAELSDNSSLASASTSVFTLTSDPPLSQREIFGLVIGSSYLALGQQGKTEDALRAFAAQALTSSYLPRYLAPITDSLANSLGLESIGVEYTPNAPVRVRFLKRLSKPFDRIIFDVSRTFGQDTSVQQTEPFRFSGSYEIFQFRASDKIQPRIQLGVDRDEQGTVTYFTRGTISF